MVKREKTKTVAMGLRMTVRDKAAIEERARDRNLTVTEYLTRAGLKRPARQRTDVDAINALRECVDELKAMHARLRGIAVGEGVIPDAEMEQTLAAICTVINRVWQPECVFRTKVTGRFGIVTGDFGNVTGRFGNVTERTGRQDWRCA